MEDIIRSLQASPLFYLFLSSRELFHTNFWFWLSTLNKAETLKLFSEEEVSDMPLSFIREHRQSSVVDSSVVDLLITQENQPLVVIENKVKDFPTQNQLQRIHNSFDDETLSYILVTLFFSADLVFEGWLIRTYGDVSNGIVPENFTQNKYHRDLIRDYKIFIKNLSDLANLLPITEVYDFAISFMPELFKTLNEIKLWEGYQKLRASHLLNKFNNRHGIETSYLLNHQKATINFHYPLRDNYEVIFSLEDNQFRTCIGGRQIGVMGENLLSKGVLFKTDFTGRGGIRLLKYDNKGDKQYRYQYAKLDEPRSFDTLFNEICFEINKVKEQKSVIESCIP